jgi:threonine aldolase
MVSTGTMANTLSLAGMCPPYGGIICDQSSHIAVDEAGAPEKLYRFVTSYQTTQDEIKALKRI